MLDGRCMALCFTVFDVLVTLFSSVQFLVHVGQDEDDTTTVLSKVALLVQAC